MHGSIRDWHAENDRGIWIQSASGQWYYATFFAPCWGIQFANAIRVLPGATSTLDRWGAVATRESGKCSFNSFVASDKPPVHSRQKKGPSAAAPGPA
jgi:hypothetical protein